VGWASFKQIDVAEQRASRTVFAARNAARVAAGGPAAALTRSQHSGRPNGCHSELIGSSNGALRLLEICPGQGGYRGLGGEAFGIRELTLRDPTTGELLPTTTTNAGTQTELITVDPRVLAERAAAALNLPDPAMRTSPEHDHVVQLASWLWIPADQWHPHHVSATAGPVTSTVTATPTRITWDMGNGDQVACDGPGTPYRHTHASDPDASDCAYTYRHSSAGQPGETYQITATIDWDLTWTATGAAGGGSLGTTSTSTTQPVRVTEIQALVQ
jgi:hypothetical protein